MGLLPSDSKKSSKGYIDGGYKIFFLNDEKSQVIDFHYHTFHKCVIVYSGVVEYCVEGETYELHGHDILWVPSYAVHKVSISNEKIYCRCVIYIDDEFMKLVNTDLAVNVGKIGKKIDFHTQINDQMKRTLVDLFGYELRKQCSLEQFAYFLLFCEKYFREISRIADKRVLDIDSIDKENRQFQIAITYIKNNLYKPLKVDEIAKHCYLSKHYFMRKFKKTTGLTVHQYVVGERLKIAREYMREGMGLTEISYKVGFNNYSTFARAFKNNYNMSPKEYLKMDPRKYDGVHE